MSTSVLNNSPHHRSYCSIQDTSTGNETGGASRRGHACGGQSRALTPTLQMLQRKLKEEKGIWVVSHLGCRQSPQPVDDKPSGSKPWPDSDPQNAAKEIEGGEGHLGCKPLGLQAEPPACGRHAFGVKAAQSEEAAAGEKRAAEHSGCE